MFPKTILSVKIASLQRSDVNFSKPVLLHPRTSATHSEFELISHSALAHLF